MTTLSRCRVLPSQGVTATPSILGGMSIRQTAPAEV